MGSLREFGKLKDSFPLCLLLQAIVKRSRLRLGRIDRELREVQRHFPAINAQLNWRRRRSSKFELPVLDGDLEP